MRIHLFITSLYHIKMFCILLLLINKIDQSDPKKLGDIVEKWHSLLPNAEILPILSLIHI